jgi:hypothetical protein
MLKELAPDQLWVAEMPASKGGFEFGARMAVVRLPEGGLWIHSPIAVEPLRKAVSDLGPVSALVAPSGMHYEHIPEWARAFPEARVFAVPAAAARLRKECRVDAELDGNPLPWGDALQAQPLLGSRLYDETDFFHAATHTLILTDLCFNIPPERGWSTRLWARALGVLGRLSISRSFGWTIRDRSAISASLRRMLEWDFDRVLLTHGDIVESGGREAFERAVSPFAR